MNLLSDAHSLDYLNVPVNDREWFDTSRHSKTRVITLGGKGRNAMPALHKWLPPGADLLLQAGDEQGRLKTSRHSGAANEHEVGDVLAALPSSLSGLSRRTKSESRLCRDLHNN